ncbi:MAG: hypothetical protein P9M07_05520 [Candidatus Aceula meridiana]|nr:hypothetical protein [Candidatus Aceula meridiana]
MTQLKKTLCVAFAFSAGFSYLAYSIQRAASSVFDSCSYLDPVVIDIVSLAAGSFLCLEAIFDIVSHQESAIKNQLARCFRMALGSCIVTIHIMQFIHK